MYPDPQTTESTLDEVTNKEVTDSRLHPAITQGFLPLGRSSADLTDPDDIDIDLSNVLFDQSFYVPDEQAIEENPASQRDILTSDSVLFGGQDDHLTLF